MHASRSSDSGTMSETGEMKEGTQSTPWSHPCGKGPVGRGKGSTVGQEEGFTTQGPFILRQRNKKEDIRKRLRWKSSPSSTTVLITARHVRPRNGEEKKEGRGGASERARKLLAFGARVLPSRSNHKAPGWNSESREARLRLGGWWGHKILSHFPSDGRTGFYPSFAPPFLSDSISDPNSSSPTVSQGGGCFPTNHIRHLDFPISSEVLGHSPPRPPHLSH